MEYTDIFNTYLDTCLNFNHIPLQDFIRYVMLNDNKHIEANLVFYWNQACKGYLENAFAFAAAIECLRMSIVIQDDLPFMNNALTRDNKECLHLISGESNVILTSDYLIGLAYNFILKAEINNIEKLNCIEMLNETLFTISNNINKKLNNNTKSVQDWLDIYHETTGKLWSLACAFGVISSKCAIKQVYDAACNYGLNLGICYEIKSNEDIDTDTVNSLIDKYTDDGLVDNTILTTLFRGILND